MQLSVRYPRFQPSPAELAAITELCCLLGGDPGAVRLVAAQIRPDEIRPTVDSIARLLDTQPDARQATLSSRRVVP